MCYRWLQLWPTERWEPSWDQPLQMQQVRRVKDFPCPDPSVIAEVPVFLLLSESLPLKTLPVVLHAAVPLLYSASHLISRKFWFLLNWPDDSSLTAQPLHWVYDLQKLQGILAQDPNPEFRSESANPFYRRQTGQQSCYGDQAFVLLESLSECGGRLASCFYICWKKTSLACYSKKKWLLTAGFIIKCPLPIIVDAVIRPVTLPDGSAAEWWAPHLFRTCNLIKVCLPLSKLCNLFGQV